MTEEEWSQQCLLAWGDEVQDRIEEERRRAREKERREFLEKYSPGFAATTTTASTVTPIGCTTDDYWSLEKQQQQPVSAVASEIPTVTHYEPIEGIGTVVEKNCTFEQCLLPPPMKLDEKWWLRWFTDLDIEITGAGNDLMGSDAHYDATKFPENPPWYNKDSAAQVTNYKIVITDLNCRGNGRDVLRKQNRTHGDYYVFYGKTHPFSVYYPCKMLVLGGISFLSIGHYLLYRKIQILQIDRLPEYRTKKNGRVVRLEPIINLLNKIRYGIPCYKDEFEGRFSTVHALLLTKERVNALLNKKQIQYWAKIRVFFMEQGIAAKMTQNPALRRKLFQTHPKIIVEGNGLEYFWANGIDIHSASTIDQKQWLGNNALGFMLTSYRNHNLDDTLLKAPKLTKTNLMQVITDVGFIPEAHKDHRRYFVYRDEQDNYTQEFSQASDNLGCNTFTTESPKRPNDLKDKEDEEMDFILKNTVSSEIGMYDMSMQFTKLLLKK